MSVKGAPLWCGGVPTAGMFTREPKPLGPVRRATPLRPILSFWGKTIKRADGVMVKVGDVAHPMEEKHYIEWVEIVADGKAYRQFLKPGDAPEAVFTLAGDAVTARAYCNIHGLWKS